MGVWADPATAMSALSRTFSFLLPECPVRRPLCGNHPEQPNGCLEKGGFFVELKLNPVASLWSKDPGDVLVSEHSWREIRLFAGLSKREMEVSRLIFRGRTRAEVAERLNISPRTVRHHMEILHEKLRVRNRVGLVLRIIQLRDHLFENQ